MMVKLWAFWLFIAMQTNEGYTFCRTRHVAHPSLNPDSVVSRPWFGRLSSLIRWQVLGREDEGCLEGFPADGFYWLVAVALVLDAVRTTQMDFRCCSLERNINQPIKYAIMKRIFVAAFALLAMATTASAQNYEVVNDSVAAETTENTHWRN